MGSPTASNRHGDGVFIVVELHIIGVECWGNSKTSRLFILFFLYRQKEENAR